MESRLVESALHFDIFIFFLFFICNLTLFNLTTWGSFGTQKRKKKSRKLKLPPPRSFPPQSRVGRFHRNVAFGRAAAPTSPRRGELRRELKLQYVHAQLAPTQIAWLFSPLCAISCPGQGALITEPSACGMRISSCRLGKLEKKDYIYDCTDLNGLREDVSPNPKSMQLFF